ncbi:MAG: hypothetical protein ACT4TC_16860 [Myxococcaceae bacterium]
MSVADVRDAFAVALTDKRITPSEVDQVVGSAGNIGENEQEALVEGFEAGDAFLEPEARTKAAALMVELPQWRARAESINAEVERRAPRLRAEVDEKLSAGVDTRSYGGARIPEAVKTLVRDALANGTTAYDVREMNTDPVLDTEHGEPTLTIEGQFNPYAQEQRAVDSMAFDYTELTPEKIEADMRTPQTYNEIVGYEGSGNDQRAVYKQVTASGNGRINALYDEATHPDTLARARGGQKYANNFAILADGSVHCVPASRRSADEPWRILTTASLARGKPMLINGHLNMEKGVVNYVGISGRLSKLARNGERFIDPVEVLKAWGFKTAPGLQATYEG